MAEEWAFKEHVIKWGKFEDLKNYDAKRIVADLSVVNANCGVFGQAL